MHGLECNAVRGSEFCETLTGGFTREFPGGRTPRRVKLQRSGTPRAVEFPDRGVELPGGGTPSRVELPGQVKLGETHPESEIRPAGESGDLNTRAQILIYVLAYCHARFNCNHALPLFAGLTRGILSHTIVPIIAVAQELQQLFAPAGNVPQQIP